MKGYVLCPQKRPVQRVLIVGSGSLRDEGLQRLLESGSSHIEVASAAYTGDAEFVQQVSLRRPTVIVMFEGAPLSVGRVFELVNGIPGLAPPRVIMVLSETSKVDVYEKQQVEVAGSDVLLELIDQNEESQSQAGEAEDRER